MIHQKLSLSSPGLNEQYMAALLGGEALPIFLRTCLDYAMSCESNTVIHPVIFVNAVKNIIGDDRENPSAFLLEYLFTTINSLDSISEDDTILKGVGSRGITDPVFVMDLEDAIQGKDWIVAEKYAAGLYLAAEHKGSVLEILTELSLQNVEHHAPLFYHLQRSTIFYQATKKNWTAIQLALNHIKQNPIPEPHIGVDISPEDILPQIVRNGNPDDSITFAACWRLWDIESVRQSGFRREISHWLSTKKSNKHHNISDEQKSKHQYNNPNYIELTERIIKRNLPQDKTWYGIVTLEAIRFLWKKCDPKFQVHLSTQIDNLINLLSHWT